MRPKTQYPRTPEFVHAQAVDSLFALFERICEGAIAVDAQARIVWINDKYRTLLGIDARTDVIGREIETVIPNSLMRQVVETGRPILLDIMQFDDRSFVVTRIPVFDDGKQPIGAVGFVLYDKLNDLSPLLSKFAKLKNDLATAERELAAARRPKYTFSQIIGASAPMLEIKRLARRATQLDTSVLLLGETGTGKELLAHAIHAASARSARPFVAVNMAAVPESLLEADFFGVAPGAYTGANRKDRDGKFKLADGGTLFLDEIGELPMHLQSKLLRALQDQEVEPVGSNKLLKVDVRVIVATSRDLNAMVERREFRSDLYFRLNVLPIALPPLRDRISDLEALCEALLEQIALRLRITQREIGPSAIDVLASYAWPGNIRELSNALERACAVSDQLRLEAEDFVGLLPTRIVPQTGPLVRPGIQHLADAVAEAERSAILAALAKANGRKAAAAKILGISRAKLYDRLERLRLLSEIST